MLREPAHEGDRVAMVDGEELIPATVEAVHVLPARSALLERYEVRTDDGRRYFPVAPMELYPPSVLD